MYTYPVILTRLENGQYMAEFSDIPQALTYGESEALALQWAQDALHEALDQYMTMHRDIPKPSLATKNQPTVSASPIIGVKLTIYKLMREQNISQEHLARLLHCDARQVRRLLDIFHNSTLEQLNLALAVLGYELEMQAKPIKHGQSIQYAYA